MFGVRLNLNQPHAMKRAVVLSVAFCLLLALPLGAADLSQLVAEAAQYQSGRNIEPLQTIEQLLRESLAKPRNEPNSKPPW